MPYHPPLPAEMPGDEAIKHIRQTERRTEADAIDQLRTAIAHHAVRARIPHDAERQIRSEVFPKQVQFFDFTFPGSSPMTTPVLTLGWAAADIRADGTVGFGSSTRCRFWVRRDDVVRIWPIAPAAQPARRGERVAAISEGIREAIANLWPNGIPRALTAKDRDNQIAEWLKANGRSTPSHGALPRAVQRVLRHMTHRP